MTVTLELELPPDLESELAAEAARLHMSLAEYVLRVLEDARLAAAQDATVDSDDDLFAVLTEARAKLADHPLRTGAEILAYWRREGLLGTRPDITDPLEYARALRRRAERRERE
jgi:hypothetical protein